LRGAALFAALKRAADNRDALNAAPWLARGRDHLKQHGPTLMRHAPLFIALWSVRRAHPAIFAWTVGKTGLELASDPKIRAAVMAAAQKLRRR
jgi:hypothetical protein